MSRSQVQQDKQTYNQQLREQSLRCPSSSLRTALADQTSSRQPPSNGISTIKAPSAQTSSAQPHSSQKRPVILVSETPSPPANPSRKLSGEPLSNDDDASSYASSYAPTPPPRARKSQSETTKAANPKRSKKRRTKSSKMSSTTPNNQPNPPAPPSMPPNNQPNQQATSTPATSTPATTPPAASPHPSTLRAWSSGGAPAASDTAALALLDAAATPLTTFLHRYPRLTVHFRAGHAVALTAADCPATGFAADAVAGEIDVALGPELEWARVGGGGAGVREGLVRRAVREGWVVVVGSGGGMEECVVRRDAEGGIGIELGDVRENGDAEGEA
ncbi:hypothetical protein NpNSSI1_00012348 [Neofusicoccum parvum]|nr:hypothetical protein NpNSSI1_00012348 [Neofusicoccum parvum]